MLKKTITFKDLDGNTLTEDFYFNLSKAEISELELRQDGGMQAYLNRIVENKNGQEIINTFKEIIAMAVGKRSEDGRRFIKTREIAEEFTQTDAYSELFMELITDPKAAAEFITAALPADLAEKEKLQQATATILPVNPPKIEEKPVSHKPWISENREPTRDELRLMSQEDMMEAFMRKTHPQGTPRDV